MERSDKKHDSSDKKKRKRRKGQEKDDIKSRKSCKGQKKVSKLGKASIAGKLEEPIKETLRASSGSSTDCHKPERKVMRCGPTPLPPATVSGKIQPIAEQPPAEEVPLETLRWSHHCSDQEEEVRRIEEYKDKRRQRYRQALEERRSSLAAHKLTTKAHGSLYYVARSHVT